MGAIRFILFRAPFGANRKEKTLPVGQSEGYCRRRSKDSGNLNQNGGKDGKAGMGRGDWE